MEAGQRVNKGLWVEYHIVRIFTESVWQSDENDVDGFDNMVCQRLPPSLFDIDDSPCIFLRDGHWNRSEGWPSLRKNARLSLSYVKIVATEREKNHLTYQICPISVPPEFRSIRSPSTSFNSVVSAEIYRSKIIPVYVIRFCRI